MNRRIRSIFWLMTACIVGINAFQGYWLWTTYQLNRQQFNRTIQDALIFVLQQEQVTEAKRLFNKQGDTTGKESTKKETHSQIIIRRFDSPDGEPSSAGETRVFINARPDSLPASLTMIKKGKQLGVNYNIIRKSTSKSTQLPADTLARQISNLLLLDWARNADVNLEKLVKSYRAELLRRTIDTDFQLDTVTIRPQQSKGNVLIFRNDLTKTKQNDNLQTTPVLVNPVRNLFVQASFATPTFYLLGRMGWLLGSSLFLLLLTTGCFLFMLATILRQKKLSDVKNDFINNMTHELKTPIATVTAAVEALQNFGALNDPKKTQTYLAISQTNLKRLSDLVEKVLNLAVAEKQELTLHPEPINLAELANDLITNHQLRAPKAVSFAVDIPADTTVSVDRVHFGNALNNLIDNAINYSRDQVGIRLTFRRNTSGWQLSVADDGIGIPKAYQSAIFDRFFRVPTGDLHPVKGFGLGLAYVRQVVEHHSGRISIHSEPGKGSEFILSF
jgi:two-component system phosphate regulon sensor histidine kinase PhoR